MSRRGPWAVLKISPTDDATEIKRAYARQLKITHPEDDPAGFQALRAAYENALNHAKWAAQRKQHAAEQAARREAGEPVDDYDDEDDYGGAEDITAEIVHGLDLSPVRPGVARPATAEEKAANPEPEPAPDRAHARPATDDEREAHRQPEPAPPPPPRVRVVAAEELDLAEPPPELQELHDIETAHVALIQRLADLVADDTATSGQRMEALEAVLKSPGMDMVIVNERTEHFLGGLIANNPRRTDEMVERVINFFGWDAARVGAWRPIAEAALRRREEVVELRYLRSPGTKSHGAFRALSKPPTFWRRVLNRLAINRPTEVRNFLWNMRQRFPGLVGELNAEAVAWWEDHFSQPRLGPIALLSSGVAVLLGLVGLIALVFGEQTLALGFANLAVLPAAIGAVLVGKHYAVDRARDLLRKRFEWDYPTWLKLGWLPAAMLPVLAAAFIPASLPATIAVGAVAALPLLWAIIAGEPDREPEGEGDWGAWGYMSLLTIPFYLTQWIWRPNMRFPWQVRTVFCFGFLAVFYAVILQEMDEAVWGQMFAPVAAAALAASFGLGTLIETWRHDASRRSRTWVGGVAIACGLVGVGLALAGPATIFAPASIAFLLVPILVHKAPAKDAGEGLRLFRDAITRYGWMLWIIFGAVLTSFNSAASPIFRSLAPWIVTGPVVLIFVTLWREWFPPKPKAKRPRWDRL